MTALFDLSGKRALVTGGAQGLGRMIAEGLLHAGAAVAITSRKPDVARRAAEEMSALGACTAYPSELATPAAAVELASRFTADGGPCHILVNNAGKTWGAPLAEFPDNAWPDIMAVNVQTPFTLIRELLPHLKRAGSATDPARVINIGSLAGAKPAKLNAYSYAASKAAIHMVSRDLAGELASDNITVNAVLPGFFPTKMTAHIRHGDEHASQAVLDQIPLHRFGEAEDIAGVVVFLCSRAGSYITGAQIPVDGGIAGCS